MALRKGLGPARHIKVGQLWIQDKVNSGDIGIEKVRRKINLADTLTKHSDSGSLETHIEGANLKYRVGRHHEAPNVAGDDVIEDIGWGTNEESYERCGTEPEGSNDNIMGYMHMCTQLKPSALSGSAKSGKMADHEEERDRNPNRRRPSRSPTRDPADDGTGIAGTELNVQGHEVTAYQREQREIVAALKEEMAGTLECEQKEMGNLFAGNVADLEELRLARNEKTERERMTHEKNVRE
jgi:hypothetical protein